MTTGSDPRAAGSTLGATIRDLLAAGGRSYSFEFFPPKTDEGERTLFETIRQLEPLAPTFVSVTYGAGGSTRDRTVRIVERIATDTTLTAVGHLTCVSSSRADLRSVIGTFAAAGIRNVLALRGDPPGGAGTPWEPHPDGLEHADELVRLLRELGTFCVGVAAFPEGHPESSDLDSDAKHLALKAAAGADFAVTQFFFDADDYFRLVDRAAAHGCTIPILPGIMPVTNLGQIQRFSELSGAVFPPALAERLQTVADDPAEVRRIGIEVATELCSTLLDGGAPGLHFYTLNRSTSTLEIYRALGLAPTTARSQG
ncbi:methylenetetrahydrofolate reductase [NAD(P)H] [Sporichthya sp.]|uniref:methylenetetrahydrofolate reductase [NAD(P)H] n=1 Tax=Sporichthya sp. TaxID=65475 RepID=UPI0017C9B8C1|nr:methylenetetrahydrofolate reductase [NAD(P)H] [Sporichthya sp.]MBA3745578.1 methylenetetrahydrofolate reductase [NAD(P)H] [Sporichthya sp.]